MNNSHLQLKALFILGVFILGFTAFERADTITAFLTTEHNTASIFNPVATFLGIPVGNSEPSGNTYESLNTYDPLEDTVDLDLGGGFFLNTPSPTEANTAQTTNVNTAQTAAVSGNSIQNEAPTLFCLPDISSEAEDIIIMWTCRDEAYKAVGTGFDTDDALIGTVRVQSTEDTTYAVECINNLPDVENTVGECSLEVAKPALAIIPSSHSVARGGTVTLSWKTKDTSACVVTSNMHQNFERKGVEGEAISPALTKTTTFILTCETVTGILTERSQTVTVN